MRLLSTSLFTFAATFHLTNASPTPITPQNSPSEVCMNPTLTPRDVSLVPPELAIKSRLFKQGLSVVNKNYVAVIPPVRSTVNTWNKGHGPQVCKDKALSTKSDGSIRCPINKLQAHEIKFDDCQKPWWVCRCDDAEMTIDQVRAQFGRIPPQMRSWVKYLMVFQQNSCSAVNANDVISFYGSCGADGPTVFIHETAHSLDHSLNIPSGRFSMSPEFNAAMKADTCIPDSYSGVNIVENFAQVSVVLMSAENAKYTGGYDTSCLKNQLNAVWAKFGSQMKNSNPGKCNMAARNREDSPIVKW